MIYRASLAIRFLLVILPIIPSLTIRAASGSDDSRTICLPLPRLSGPITLDGMSDEAAWQAIEPVPLTMMTPIFEGAMTEKTEIRVAYDDDYLYVAALMYESDPANIRAADLVRDAANWQNDWLFILIDSFNDNENLLGFATNPAGILLDYTTTNDSPNSFNNSWSTFWEAAVQRNDQGWFAEMRIPFSSLRFQDDDGAVIMGLTLARYIARNGESHVFPAIPPNWGEASFWKASQAQRVLLSGVYSRNPLYITPYALGGLDQTASLNPTGSTYGTNNTPTREIGLDVKYGLTSNLTLDLTLNTDFAQVEADNEQINLTRFDLFFPEKRLFFQERASTFEFGLGGRNRLFHSRSIGIHDGSQVPIYGGARLVGRVGIWDFAAIDMQTAPIKGDDGETGLSSENMGVVRLRRQVVNPYSYVGGMVTNRMGTDGIYNRAYGLDGILRVFGEDYVTASWAQVFDSEWEETPDVLDAGQLRMNWERRGVKGLVYNMDVIRRGDSFQPGLGFVDRTNITLLEGRMGYGWFANDSSSIQRHRPMLNGTVYKSTSTGEVESAIAGFDWDLVTKKRAEAGIWLTSNYEALADSFSIAQDVDVPPGNYSFPGILLYYDSIPGGLLTLYSSLEIGRFYDGRRLTTNISPTWRPNQYFMAGGSIRYDHIKFSERNQEYVNWIYQLNLQTAFNATTSVAGLIQYNSAIHAVIVNLRLRYNPREGTDLYLVYNDNLNTELKSEDPALPLSSTRAVLLKYSTTFLPSLQ